VSKSDGKLLVRVQTTLRCQKSNTKNS